MRRNDIREMMRAAAVAAVLGLAAGPGRAQDFEIDWFTIDGGGTNSSTGGDFHLSGTIGQPDAGPAAPGMTGGDFSLTGGFWTAAPAAPTPVTIVLANPPAANPYGSGPFRDVLQNTTTALSAQGIGVPGTPPEGPYNYDTVSVTFSGAPSPAPAPTSPPTAGSVMVSCTGGTCPTVTAVSGSGAGPYLLTVSGGIPVLQCTTFTFAGTNAGQKLQYQNLTGDVNINGATTGQDVLSEVTAINNGTANLAANLARYDVNRNGAVTGQDVLRLVQLINGTSATQSFNGATVAACP